MAIPRIQKEYAFKGSELNITNFNINGNNKTYEYVNPNDYALDLLVTINGGVGQRNFAFFGGDYGFTYYHRGANGSSVQCKVNNNLIAVAAGGAGSGQSARVDGWRTSRRCGFLKSRVCWSTHYNPLKQPTYSQSGEVKIFLVSLKPNERIVFVFTQSNGGGNGSASVTILQ